MRALGYYKNQVRADLIRTPKISGKAARSSAENKDRLDGQQQTDDLKAIYAVTPGPRYLIDKVSIVLNPEIDPARFPELPVKAGQPLVADEVFAAVAELEKHVATDYCYYNIKVDYDAAVSHARHVASLTFSMKPAEQVDFGKVSVEGLQTIDEDYLVGKVKIKEGECFKARLVNKGRISLLRTGLLARVSARYSQPAKGIVDITYDIQERDHRTVKAGIGYSTDEDFNISSGWEHRNILGSNEKLELDATLSKNILSLEGKLKLPNFFHKDLSLNLSIETELVDRDAYESQSIEAGIKLMYRFNSDLKFSVGSDVEYSNVEDALSRSEFYLVSLPLQATWDTTDDVLDPSRGHVLFAEFRPYFDFVDNNTRFVKSTISASKYHQFDTWLTPILAVRLAAGTINGENTPNIPADERFYAGGGGSIRGYSFESVGQKIVDDDGNEEFIGGSYFHEVSAEMRFRLNEDWGFVTFTDGGYAFTEALPDFGDKLLWGAGIGLRYYTLAAPFRLDIAFPLNKREEENDRNYLIYINIGQAF